MLGDVGVVAGAGVVAGVVGSTLGCPADTNGETGASPADPDPAGAPGSLVFHASDPELEGTSVAP